MATPSWRYLYLEEDEDGYLNLFFIKEVDKMKYIFRLCYIMHVKSVIYCSFLEHMPNVTEVCYFSQDCHCCVSAVLQNGSWAELQRRRDCEISVSSFTWSVCTQVLSATCSCQSMMILIVAFSLLSRVAVGLAFGIVSVLWLGFIFNDTVIEIALTLAVSYVAYFTVRYPSI